MWDHVAAGECTLTTAEPPWLQSGLSPLSPLRSLMAAQNESTTGSNSLDSPATCCTVRLLYLYCTLQGWEGTLRRVPGTVKGKSIIDLPLVQDSLFFPLSPESNIYTIILYSYKKILDEVMRSACASYCSSWTRSR